MQSCVKISAGVRIIKPVQVKIILGEGPLAQERAEDIDLVIAISGAGQTLQPGPVSRLGLQFTRDGQLDAGALFFQFGIIDQDPAAEILQRQRGRAAAAGRLRFIFFTGASRK